jgi:hypothetical protein
MNVGTLYYHSYRRSFCVLHEEGELVWVSAFYLTLERAKNAGVRFAAETGLEIDSWHRAGGLVTPDLLRRRENFKCYGDPAGRPPLTLFEMDESLALHIHQQVRGQLGRSHVVLVGERWWPGCDMDRSGTNELLWGDDSDLSDTLELRDVVYESRNGFAILDCYCYHRERDGTLGDLDVNLWALVTADGFLVGVSGSYDHIQEQMRRNRPYGVS